MISKSSCLFVFVWSLLHANVGNAYCREHLIDKVGENFQITYNCENTENLVEYQVIRQITENVDFEFFTFDPRGWNLMCSKLSYNDETVDSQCIHTGIKRPLSYKSGLKTLAITLNTGVSALEKYYLNRENYSYFYPNVVELYADTGCAIMVRSGEILLFSSNNALEATGECLLQYELYLTQKK